MKGDRMDKRQITDDIKQYLKSRGKDANWINQSEIAAYMGICRQKAADITNGIEYYPDGKQHKFLASDVAGRIFERRQSA